MSRYTKTMLLASVTAVLIGLSWWLQADVSLADPAPFRRAVTWLAGVGVLLLSVGIFRRRGAGAIFSDVVGGLSLITGLALFVLFGGMDNTQATGADTAMNVVLLMWTALPLSFVILTLCRALNIREDNRPRRRLVSATAVGLALWLAVLVFAGQMLSFVHIKEDTPDIGTDLAWVDMS